MGKLTRRRVITYGIIAAIVVVGGIGILKKRQATNKVMYRTTMVTRGDITTSVSATGTIEPRSTVEVKSNVGGQLVYLGVDEGDEVKSGQVIARIDPSDAKNALDQSRAEYDSALSSVAQAKDNLAMQRAQYPAKLSSAEQDVATARLKLAQSEKDSSMQTTITAADIDQAQEAVTAAKAKVAQAEEEAKLQPRLTDAAIAQAKSNLAAAEASYKQTKSASVPQKIASAQTALNQANADLTYANKNLERQRGLLEKGYVARSVVDAAEQSAQVAQAQVDNARQKFDTVKDETQEDLDAAQAKVDQAQAALNTAEANRVQDTLKQHELSTARSALKQAEAALKSAEANRGQISVKNDAVSIARSALRQAEESLTNVRASAYETSVKQGDITQARAKVQSAGAQLSNAQTQLGYTTITAPCSGVVVEKDVETGTVVAAGKSSLGGSGSGVTLLKIADMSSINATVNVDETDIAQVKVGQEVDITVDAYPNEHFTGTVTKIAPETVTAENITTVPVTVEFDRTDQRLKPGMNATCDFITSRKTDVLTVPTTAVMSARGEATVQVIKQGKPAMQKVKTGISDDNNTEILEGLNEGDTIVAEFIAPQQKSPDASSMSNKQKSNGPGGGPGGPGGMPPM